MENDYENKKMYSLWKGNLNLTMQLQMVIRI